MNKKNIVGLAIVVILLIIVAFFSFKMGQAAALNKITERSFEWVSIDESLKDSIIAGARKNIDHPSYILQLSDLKYYRDKRIVQLNITPFDKDLEAAMMFVEISQDGSLIFTGPGTAFPDLSEKYPGVFE